MVKNLQEKTFPNVLGYFEKQASTNGASEGWIFGKVMNDCCCSYLTSDVSRHISNLLRPAQCQSIYMFFLSLFLLPTTYTQLTYADFYFYTALENMLKQMPTLLDNFPTLKKLWSSVEALPNIAKWLKERPESQF